MLKEARPWLSVSRATPPSHRYVLCTSVLASNRKRIAVTIFATSLAYNGLFAPCTQVHAWGSRIPEDTLSAIMNTNQNIRNFGGSDTLMLSKINMDASDARVLAALLKDNMTVTKVSAGLAKRTYICCMPSCACCNQVVGRFFVPLTLRNMVGR